MDDKPVLLTQNGDTYTGTYRAGAQTIELQLVVGTKNRVYYTDTTTTTPTDRYVDDGPVVNFQVNRDQYADAEGNVTIEFSVADASDAKVRDYYTVELTPVEASTETEILEFALDRTVNAGNANENTVPNIGEVNIGVDFINVTVPYDAADLPTTYTIRNMVLSDGATATVRTDRGAAVADGIDVAGVQNGAPSVTVDDEYTITVPTATTTRPTPCTLKWLPASPPSPPKRAWTPCCSPALARLLCCCPMATPQKRLPSP